MFLFPQSVFVVFVLMDFFVLSIFLFVHFGLFGMAVRTDSQSQWIQCPARYSHCIMLWHSLTLWTWWCRCACFATLSVNGIDPFCVCVFFRGCDYDAMLRVLFFCVHLFNTILEIFRIYCWFYAVSWLESFCLHVYIRITFELLYCPSFWEKIALLFQHWLHRSIMCSIGGVSV